MNKIFEQVEKLMNEALNKYLPEVSKKDLEKDGAVFYMNGQNGTAFEWYVNDHFPSFFIFYGDEEELGAVKAMLYNDGRLVLYVYGEKGHGEPQHLDLEINAEENELMELAALLTRNADDNRIWDEDIRDLDCEGEPDAETIERFLSQEKHHESMRKRREILGKTVIVSKKVREEGWKIGYGLRDKPTGDNDSGWFFSVGNETEEYVNNPANLELWLVNSALMYDPALNEFIISPYGTEIIRTASDKFEIDDSGKEIFFEKRE